MTRAHFARKWSPLGAAMRTGGLGAALAGLALAGCATAAPYNPAGLDQAHLGRVASICQSVMGLSPDESHIPNDGNPRLDPLESHFEGCIATLSHSLERTRQAATLVQADRDCRAAGARRGPELAECVLRARDAAPARVAEAGTLTPVVASTTPIHGFIGTSHREKTLRMERACAAIGLNPAHPSFDGCVKEMTDTFFAIDNPWN